MKTIKKSKVETIRTQKAENWSEFKSRAILDSSSLPTGGWSGFFVLLEPIILRLVPSSFTQKLCPISNTDRFEVAGWTRNIGGWESSFYDG